MILIIDDEVSFGQSLERLFRFAGHDAVHTASGLEGLSLLDVRKPVLIILDLQMPTMNGLTFLRSVRKDPAYKSVPIMVYTSSFADDVRMEAIDSGAQDFVVKGTMGWEAFLKRAEELLGIPKTLPFVAGQ